MIEEHGSDDYICGSKLPRRIERGRPELTVSVGSAPGWRRCKVRLEEGAQPRVSNQDREDTIQRQI